MPDDPAIVADGLTKRFGDVLALDDVSLSVPAGTVLGLLGPNGAGKTTAVRILTTILRPDAGHATVLGHDVVRSADTVRTLIGLAGQYAAVDENLTARENLRLVGRLTHLPAAVIRQRTDELLARFALVDAADRPVKTYSGGMRRRVDLAAALVHRPPVLFLDEPTTGLDPQGRNDLWSVIEELVSDGATLLLTTQYLEEADRLAHHIAVVDHGKVIAEGTPADLKASLGATVLEFTLHDEAEAGRAADALAASPSAAASGNAPSRDGVKVELSVEAGARVVIDALRTLDAAGVEPASLAVREPSLDDVFLSLTGHRAEADATEGDAA
jgi:daunorubicin resistance ABC transporter ATP-binding subunit